MWSTSISTASSGTFSSAESSNGCSLSGNFTRQANGFIKKTITSCSGCAYCPAANSVRYSIEAPGFSLFTPPTLTTEGQIISAVAASGSCPTATWTGVFIFSIWNSAGAHNLTSNFQPAYGVFSWNPSTNQSTVSAIYNLSANTAIGGVTPIVSNGTCSNGVITFSGAGDRGGTMYISSSRGAVFKTLAGRSLFILPQNPIPAVANLAGTYSVINYDDASSQTIRSFRMTISGTAGSGDSLSDVETGTTNSAETWSFSNIAINQPVNGMFTADLSLEGGGTRKTACGAYLRDKTVIFCVAQSPTNATAPMNFAMVSDAQGISSATTAALDTYSFGSGTGKVSQNLAGVDGANAMAIQPDGKFVVVGSMTNATQDAAIARFEINGALDTSFDSDGFRAENFGSASDTYLGVALQSDGKVVAVGSDNVDLVVTRYNSNGTLDTTFDGNGGAGNGIVKTNPNSRIDYAYGVAIQSNGRIVVSGVEGGVAINAARGHLVRYLSDGILDTSFGTGGIFNLGVGRGVTKLAMQSDGKIVGAGYLTCMHPVSMQYWPAFYVARVTPAGALDTSYSANLAGCNAPAPATDLVVQADGKVVVVGNTQTTNFAVARLTSTFALDTAFDGNSGTGNGIFLLDMGSSELTGGIALQQDGKIVLAGSANSDVAIARLLPSSGVLDTTFDTDGRYTVSVGSGVDRANAIAIQEDKKIVIAGSDAANFVLVRVWQ